jgi:hypothetical protein
MKDAKEWLWELIEQRVDFHELLDESMLDALWFAMGVDELEKRIAKLERKLNHKGGDE